MASKSSIVSQSSSLPRTSRRGVPRGAYSVGTAERSTTIAPYSLSAVRIVSTLRERTPLNSRGLFRMPTPSRSRTLAPAGSERRSPIPLVTEAGWTKFLRAIPGSETARAWSIRPCRQLAGADQPRKERQAAPPGTGCADRVLGDGLTEARAAQRPALRELEGNRAAVLAPGPPEVVAHARLGVYDAHPAVVAGIRGCSGRQGKPVGYFRVGRTAVGLTTDHVRHLVAVGAGRDHQRGPGLGVDGQGFGPFPDESLDSILARHFTNGNALDRQLEHPG